MITKAAQDRRESARDRTGEFGVQLHAESGIVDPGPPAVIYAQKAFARSSSALFAESCIDVYRWARAADIDADHIDDLDMQLALYGMWEADELEAERLCDATEDTRWAVAEQRMVRILAEAERRTEARAELAALAAADDVQPRNGWIVSALRRDLKAAERLQLLPDGATASVELSGGAKNPQIMVLIKGMPDRMTPRNGRDADGDRTESMSEYAQRVQEMVSRIQNRYYAPDGPHFVASVETEWAAKRRVAGEALDAAEKKLRAATRTGGGTTALRTAVKDAKTTLYNSYA